MSNYDWSRFTKRIDVNVPIETLYTAWSTRRAMEDWFLRLCDYKKPDGTPRAGDEPAEKGDSYTWRWHGWANDTTETGTILEANGQDYFSFSFGGEKAGDMRVNVTLKTEEGVSIVEVTQENIPTDENGKTQYHLGCMEGWVFYLANLKSVLQGGIDLRNRNEKLGKIINK